MGDLHFLYNLKIVNFFLSHTYTQMSFPAQGYFFSLPQSFFRICFKSNSHSQDPFLILGNTRFHYRLYNGLLLFSRAPQDSINAKVFLIRRFLFCNTGIGEIICSKKDIFHTQPPKQNLYLLL